MFVPVVSKDQETLMPTTPSRARKWIKEGKATFFWSKGIFCVRLNKEPSHYYKQDIAVGIDPGSKMGGFTVKSEDHTYLNIQAEAVTHVKKSIEVRKNIRRSRRFRKTRRRKCKTNRSLHSKLPPSTKARWQWKLRIINQLRKIFPIIVYVVEDTCAITKKGKRRWNKSFSPLEVGKKWFYKELEKLGKVVLKKGYETKEIRDSLGLKKSSKKLDVNFNVHCVDSWCLAYSYVGGKGIVDNRGILFVKPIRFYRRQLHVMQYAKGGIRKRYGGTVSLGFIRGSVVYHKKYGICYIGGNRKNKLSLHNITTGERLTRSVMSKDIEFKCYNSWKYGWIR